MKKAIITGSFDPVTAGHADHIRRASEIFDEVFVVILSNGEKSGGMFSAEERLALCEKAVEKMSNVSVIQWYGLASEAAHSVGAKYIVRGARNASDFDYENDLAAIMKRFDGELETVILPSSPSLSMISSTYVRELIKYGCDLTDSVPDGCAEMIKTFKEGKK